MDIDNIQEGMDLSELLQELLDGGYIEHETSIGVTKKIISDGLESIKGNQVTVYDNYIKPIFSNPDTKCARCQVAIEDLPTNEKFFLLSQGYCPLCDHRMGKAD